MADKDRPESSKPAASGNSYPGTIVDKHWADTGTASRNTVRNTCQSKVMADRVQACTYRVLSHTNATAANCSSPPEWVLLPALVRQPEPCTPQLRSPAAPDSLGSTSDKNSTSK
jgi:hypothetical protein